MKMGTILITFTEEAESWVRGKNNRKGDMSRYIENLVLSDKKKGA
jgi:hypothetical protein